MISHNATDSNDATDFAFQHVFTSNGRRIIFHSTSPEISNTDFNFESDIFFYDLPNPDSDGDFLDDDWELAYFNDLSQTGSADYDFDGASNYDEFFSWTNPTDDLSQLSVSIFTEFPNTHLPIIRLNSIRGKYYQIQYKDGPDDLDWKNLGKAFGDGVNPGMIQVPAPIAFTVLLSRHGEVAIVGGDPETIIKVISNGDDRGFLKPGTKLDATVGE